MIRTYPVDETLRRRRISVERSGAANHARVQGRDAMHMHLDPDRTYRIQDFLQHCLEVYGFGNGEMDDYECDMLVEYIFECAP